MKKIKRIIVFYWAKLMLKAFDYVYRNYWKEHWNVLITTVTCTQARLYWIEKYMYPEGGKE